MKACSVSQGKKNKQNYFFPSYPLNYLVIPNILLPVSGTTALQRTGQTRNIVQCWIARCLGCEYVVPWTSRVLIERPHSIQQNTEEVIKLCFSVLYHISVARLTKGNTHFIHRPILICVCVCVCATAVPHDLGISVYDSE